MLCRRTHNSRRSPRPPRLRPPTRNSAANAATRFRARTSSARSAARNSHKNSRALASLRMTQVNGIEWLVDAQGCHPARLANVETLEALFAAIVKDLSLCIVGDAIWHVFPTTSGITGLCLLAESHLTVHTFP